MKKKTFCMSALVAALAAFSWQGAAAQESQEVTIARILGINFLPTYVMEKNDLIKKHAAELGIADLQVGWQTVSGGGSATDALLADAVDVAVAGGSNLLLLWDRTRGGIKGIVSNAALPVALITRDPKIDSLDDYTANDRIAVPTVGVSTQAVLLQMAAAKQFGDENWKKMDSNTVQMGHTDAMASMMNESHEVRSHFASPPFISRELKNVPGAHVVTTANDILGTPLSTAIMFTKTDFAEANPKLMEAIRLASKDAIEVIKSNPQQAARDYLDISGDPLPVDELVQLIEQPDMIFSVAPEGTMKLAKHLHATGVLKSEPSGWTDYFLPSSADLNGN